MIVRTKFAPPSQKHFGMEEVKMHENREVSYIGNPRDHSVMYVSKKVEALLQNLEGHTGCLVFCEEGCVVPELVRENNEIVMTANPQLDYARYVERMTKAPQGKYTMTAQGVWLGENVTLGQNVRLEPLCLIGHGVVIGDNTVVASGSRIYRAVIGSNVTIEANAVIGTECFTYTRDEHENLYKIPSGGSVIVGDYAFIGASAAIETGSVGITKIEPYAKLDAHVSIGHDAIVGSNTEITAGAVLGGFAVIGENVFIGMNATVKNRVEIGKNSTIGMGCIVTKNIPPDSQMTGNMIGSSLKKRQEGKG